ncbi:MAG: YXWGXW repeat-containing protein [Acidobacteriaceae bacterium]|nr:YXWGXW repeat-containing protein [Acidobacteriaceae bacterium]
MALLSRLQYWALASALAGAVALIGCGHWVYYASAELGPPPPPLVYGPIGAAPAPDYVWTEGYYQYFEGGWEWRPGRWVRPPHRGDIWVKPYWQREGSGYRFHHGHWQHPH